MRPKRVVIDTANEIDDQFALGWALLAPEQLDVIEIHATPFSHGSYFTALAAAVDHRGGGAATAFEEMALGVGPGGITSMLERRSPGDGMRRSIDEIDRVLHAADASSPDAARPAVVAGADCFMASSDDAVDSDAVRRLIASAPKLVYIPGYQVAAVLSVSLPELEQHVAGRGPLDDFLVELYHENPLAAAPTTPRPQLGHVGPGADCLVDRQHVGSDTPHGRCHPGPRPPLAFSGRFADRGVSRRQRPAERMRCMRQLFRRSAPTAVLLRARRSRSCRCCRVRTVR